jgi:cell division protein FtsB
MASFKNIGNKVKLIFLNKYLLLLIGFAVVITFVGDYNLIKRWKTTNNIKQLEKEISFYKDEIESTMEKMRELQSSDENLEKFAREQYFMKKENEDIFIVKE